MRSLVGLVALLASAQAVLAGSLPNKIYGVNVGGWYVMLPVRCATRTTRF